MAESVLGSAPPIVQCILSHLPMKDLNRCSTVCKLWRDIVRTLKRRRHGLSWMFWTNRSSFGRSKRGPVREIDGHIGDVLRNMSSQPKLAILFSTNAFFDDQAVFMHCEVQEDAETPMVEHLMTNLPADCLLVGTSSDGITGTSFLGDKCTEVENSPGFSCLLLPQMPGVEIYPFVIKEVEDLCKINKRNVLSDDDMFRLTAIPQDRKVKATIFFCCQDQAGEAARLIARTLLEKQKYELAFGGGFIDTLVAPKHMLSKQKYMPHTLGIAFCGPNVEAASILLPSSVISKEAVEQNFLKLKKVGLCEEKSFAFMFACVGRGENHFKEDNVEADIFHKLFPKTPLFGFFGNGEIGLSRLLCSQSVDRKPPAGKNCPSIFHGYTSVFVLISIKNNS